MSLETSSRARSAAVLLALAGASLLASALPHGLAAGPHYLERLAAAGVDADTRAAIAAGWWFGTTMFVAAGIIVLGQAVQAWRGMPVSTSSLWPLSLGIGGFGLAAFVGRGFNTHYLAFIGAGLLLAWGTALARPRGR